MISKNFSDTHAPPATRLYVTDDLAPGRELVTSIAQNHLLRHVLRLTTGDTLALFNGRDGEYGARITGFTKSGAMLTVTDRRSAPVPSPPIRLLIAPVKRARLDLILEKATELGVARISPVITRHTTPTRINSTRWQAQTIEAAEQCGRTDVPVIDPPIPLAAALAAWPAAEPLFWCREPRYPEPRTGAPSLPAPSPQLAQKWPTATPFGVLVGPEGGFAPEEFDLLAGFDFVTAIGLGPRILRADTAVVAALALLQMQIGDWSTGSGPL